MKLSENVYVLKLQSPMNEEEFIYPTLLTNNIDTILIDTGYPGQLEQIKKAMSDEGIDIKDLTEIVFTHHDIDHIGCGKVIQKEVPNIKMVSSEVESKYLNGEKTPLKLAKLEKELNDNPENDKSFYFIMKKFFEENTLEVDEVLHDEDKLKNFKNIEVIETPGHTLGHISLYINDIKTLIAGDLLTMRDGKIEVMDSNLNEDNDMYKRSLGKLSKYNEVEQVVCYHGGVFKV